MLKKIIFFLAFLFNEKENNIFSAFLWHYKLKLTTLIDNNVINKSLLEKLKLKIIFKMVALSILKDIIDTKS